MEIFLIIVILIIVILNIILFFKIWGMTNDVDRIFTLLQEEFRKKEKKQINYEQKTSETSEANETTGESPKPYEFDPTIKIGDIVRLKSNNTRYKVDDIADGIYYCRDMVFDKLFKFNKDEIVKYVEDQVK